MSASALEELKRVKAVLADREKKLERLRELDSLREQLATVTRERNEAREDAADTHIEKIVAIDEREVAKVEAARLAEFTEWLRDQIVSQPTARDLGLLFTHKKSEGVRRLDAALASTDVKDWLRADRMRVAMLIRSHSEPASQRFLSDEDLAAIVDGRES